MDYLIREEEMNTLTSAQKARAELIIETTTAIAADGSVQTVVNILKDRHGSLRKAGQ